MMMSRIPRPHYLVLSRSSAQRPFAVAFSLHSLMQPFVLLQSSAHPALQSSGVRPRGFSDLAVGL